MADSGLARFGGGAVADSHRAAPGLEERRAVNRQGADAPPAKWPLGYDARKCSRHAGDAQFRHGVRKIARHWHNDGQRRDREPPVRLERRSRPGDPGLATCADAVDHYPRRDRRALADRHQPRRRAVESSRSPAASPSVARRQRGDAGCARQMDTRRRDEGAGVASPRARRSNGSLSTIRSRRVRRSLADRWAGGRRYWRGAQRRACSRRLWNAGRMRFMPITRRSIAGR